MAIRAPATIPRVNSTLHGVTFPCTNPLRAPLMPSTLPAMANLPVAAMPKVRPPTKAVTGVNCICMVATAAAHEQSRSRGKGYR